MQPVGSLVLVVFVGSYLLISSERVNRAAMAVTGMGLAGIILWLAHNVDPSQGATFRELIEHIEWHTILFIIAMMVIVTVASSSGMFQFIAITIARSTQGDTRRLFILFNVFVFFISLFFDTVSTILIIAPLTIEVCKALDIDFRPFLISEAVVCNFASIPSIVGAVPNLVIADKTGISAGSLFLWLLPLSALLMIISLALLLRWFDDTFVLASEDLVHQMMLIDPELMIRSRKDFYMSVVAIVILVLGFTVGVSVGFEPVLVATVVAFVMLLFTRERVDNILAKIGWGTILFLIGVFGLVASLDITGIIDDIAAAVGLLVGGHISLAVVFLVWVPAVLSAVIDNIPVSVVLAPIVIQLSGVSPVLPAVLIFAVNVGGYLLPIGAPANLLVLSMAEQQRTPISLVSFARVASVLAVIHLLVGTGWLILLALLVH